MDKSTSKRKEREKEARREAILKAAATVFSHKSYHEATLDEIAAEAELAKGTLYNYYRDKQDLFFSLVDRGLGQFMQNIETQIATGGTLENLLSRCFTTSLQIVKDHKYLYRLMLTAGAHLDEKVQGQVMENWHKQTIKGAEKLAQAFAEMPEMSHLTPSERSIGANLVFSAIHSLHHRQMIERDAGDLSEDIENYVRLIVRALTSEKTT